MTPPTEKVAWKADMMRWPQAFSRHDPSPGTTRQYERRTAYATIVTTKNDV
jgi:hypothetical protein